MKKEPKPFFDLEPTALQVKNLKDGMNSPFWETMKELLMDEKEIAEVAVFENELLDEKQRDFLRVRRNLLAYVIDLPELVIDKAKPKKKQTEPDLESYD